MPAENTWMTHLPSRTTHCYKPTTKGSAGRVALCDHYGAWGTLEKEQEKEKEQNKADNVERCFTCSMINAGKDVEETPPWVPGSKAEDKAITTPTLPTMTESTRSPSQVLAEVEGRIADFERQAANDERPSGSWLVQQLRKVIGPRKVE